MRVRLIIDGATPEELRALLLAVFHTTVGTPIGRAFVVTHPEGPTGFGARTESLSILEAAGALQEILAKTPGDRASFIRARGSIDRFVTDGPGVILERRKS